MENKFFSADSSNVKLLGRTLDDNGTRWLILSASGIEFEIETKSLSFDLLGDECAHPSTKDDGSPEMNWARYEIFVDEKSVAIGSMDEKSKRVTVFDGDKIKKARVRFIKLSEGTQSYLGIKNIVVDSDAKLSPTPQKKLKIEFIGDSITCGYGVEGKCAEELFSTQTENATKAYAYMTAKNLDADYLLTSFSGFGIVSGWTNDGNKNTIQLVPPHYEKFCFNWNSKMFEDHKWNFDDFKSDLIVVNLGTNDDSYTGENEDRQNEYASEYVKFLKDIRSKNPDAYFVLTMGIMLGGNRLFGKIEKAAAEYTGETGDDRISLLHFVPQTPEEGFGCDYHPSEATQLRCSNVLTDFIKKLIDGGKIWTKKS